MSTTESTRRSIGDKLLILGAHYNAHPELPESINIDSDSDGNLIVQLDNGAITGIHAWVATMANVTWRADDFRDSKWSRPLWHVFALGIIASMPVVVWLGIPGDYADTADAVIAKLAAESRETTALVGGGVPVSPERLREYAEFLIKDAASEIEYLSVFEMWEMFGEGEISDDDMKVVEGLIAKATITVSFPDIPAGGAS